MSTRNTFKLLFILNKSKVNSEGAPIVLRITLNGTTASMNVGRRIPLSEWDKKAREPKRRSMHFDEISALLETYRMKAYQAYSDLLKEYDEITAENVRNRMQGHDGIEIKTIVSVYEAHNQELEKMVGRGISKTVYRKHCTCLKHFKSFMKHQYRMKDMPIKQIKYNVVRAFFNYLQFDLGLQENTSIKFMQNFKKITNHAMKSGWLSQDPFDGMSLRLPETDRPYLTEEELKKLEETHLPLFRLQTVRDLFIFACYTGLSYSDVKKLKRSEIEKDSNGMWWIRTRRIKTKTKSQVPLLARAKTIIDKYCQLETLKPDDLVLPVMSNQKLNLYLRDVRKECGIEKKLTFHVARHTFATTVTLQNGVPIESVSRMLGHTNIRTTQHYARIVDRKLAEDMTKLTMTGKFQLA
ncbi:site-specific integrase [Phaeocystidibacter luteus]|uniref:Site-specific integrase n=1 Tax=Phaeocystidibacter luteus TaxID=911197 RepID=A0A6N6RDT1_9FLAO|nr:site-specific integrase [Phaeocystidibacter luteus]KAB2805315.1 site-specific integrase [Phaeocystidibacter luteus]